jgi:hypothetical protein
MPSQGWIRFDPTPRGDGVNPSTSGDLPFAVESYLDEAGAAETAPQGPAALPDTGPRNLPESLVGVDTGSALDEPESGGFPMWIVWSGLAMILAAAALPIAKGLRRRRRMQRLVHGDVSAAWLDLIDRMADLGVAADPGATPLEVAASLGSDAVPLAVAYGRVAYGDPSRPAHEVVASATRSLLNTRESLRTRYGTWQRLAAGYRVGSLLPEGLRRRLGGAA